MRIAQRAKNTVYLDTTKKASYNLLLRITRGASGEEEKRLKLKSKGISPHFTI